MSTFKKAKVVMLPTNQKTNRMICKDITGQDKIIAIKTKYLMAHEDYIGHHLYIISDDEIKEGDWFLSDSRGTKQEPPKYRVEQCIKVENGWIFGHIEGMEVGHNPDWSKQIIATTEASLEIVSKGINPVYEQLPQPSQQFIEKYIEEYNKGNVITDALVEYKFNDFNFMATLCTTKEKEYILKINPKDNTITIKKLKEVYTKEELCQVLEKYTSFIWSEVGIHYPISLGIDAKDKFINNEL